MAKSEIIEQENCRRVLKVDIPQDEVKAGFDRVYKDIIKNASVPGFRKGKVPLDIIKARYAETAMEEVMRKLISSSFYDAVKEKNLEVLTEPLIEEGKLSPEEAFSYKVTFEVRPEIKLGDYNKIKLTKRVKKIAQQDIDNTLKDIQERFSRYSAAEGKDLCPGSYALVDIKISEGGKENVNREGIIIRVDDQSFGPGFSEKVGGLKKGEEREFALRVSVKENDKDVEKELHFWLRLREVKEKNTPPVDDGLAKDAGFDNLEELKKDIRKRLEYSEEMRSFNEMRDQIDECLLKTGDLIPPESVVKAREESLLEEIRHDMEHEGKKEEYNAREEEFKKGIKENNLKRIKLAYLLDEIGKREDIKVTKEETEESLKNIFGEEGERLRKAIEKMEKEKTLENYALRIRDRKIYQHLIDKAEIKEE